jgi:hypothetical protein
MKHNELLTCLIVFLFVLSMLTFGHCTTTNNRPNSLGVSEVYQNPYAYLLAEPIEVTLLDGSKYTNVRFWPYATPALYEETVLFCGDQSDYFSREPIILTYEKQAHSMYQGIACHKLVGAISITGLDKDEGIH